MQTYSGGKFCRLQPQSQNNNCCKLTLKKMCQSINRKESSTSCQNKYASQKERLVPIQLHERKVMSPALGFAAPDVTRAPKALMGRTPTGTVPKLTHCPPT